MCHANVDRYEAADLAVHHARKQVKRAERMLHRAETIRRERAREVKRGGE